VIKRPASSFFGEMKEITELEASKLSPELIIIL